MIMFDADNKLIWQKIKPEQVKEYIHFLNCELGRHMVERSMSDQKSTDALPKNKLLSELWRSAHKRHIDDIHAIEKLIRQVKEYFGVEEL